jgi:hypothetical protein
LVEYLIFYLSPLEIILFLCYIEIRGGPRIFITNPIFEMIIRHKNQACLGSMPSHYQSKPIWNFFFPRGGVVWLDIKILSGVTGAGSKFVGSRWRKIACSYCLDGEKCECGVYEEVYQLEDQAITLDVQSTIH